MANTKAKIIMVMLHEKDIITLGELSLAHNITEKIWLGSIVWMSSSLIKTPKYSHIYRGALGFALRHGDVPGLKHFLTNLKHYSVKQRVDAINHKVANPMKQSNKQKRKKL